MKEQLPLTDRDFAVVRKSVMAAIEARQARHVRTVRAMQLAFAVGAKAAPLHRRSLNRPLNR